MKQILLGVAAIALMFAARLEAGTPAFRQASATRTTYRLNVATAVYRAGQHYESSILTIDRDGDWVTAIVDPITTTGARSHAELHYRIDGQEYPVKGSLPDGADTVVLTQIDPATIGRVDKREGQIVGRLTIVRSADGHTLTMTHKGIRTDGQPFDHTIVYEKQ